MAACGGRFCCGVLALWPLLCGDIAGWLMTRCRFPWLQVCYFKKLMRKYGSLMSYIGVGTVTLTSGCLLLPVGILPLLSACEDGATHCSIPTVNTVLSWAILVVALCLTAVGFMTCMPVVQVMLINIADNRIQGLTQGVAQSVSSLLRAVGPFTSGFAFSYFAGHSKPYMMFAVLAVGYVTCALLAMTLKAEEVDHPCADK